MLDDKNDTIQNLKLQFQNIQKELQGKIDSGELQKLNNKYKKNKEKVKELEDKMLDVIGENKELNQKLEIFGSMEQEFAEIKDTMFKQEN